jgi:type VI secretion system protein ImpA
VTDFDRFLAPIEGDSPCGPDCEYDNEFLALTLAAAGKAEQQFGDTKIAASEPDWREADRLAQALLTRSKDLRIVAWLTLASTHLHGVGDFAGGLKLALGLCERYWDTIHPRIEVDGDTDPYLRMNAIAEFSVADFSTENRLIVALRQSPIIKLPIELTFRDLELAFNKAPEAAYDLKQIEPVLTQALASNSPALVAISEAYVSYLALCALVDERLDVAEAPDMQRLANVLKPVVKGLERLRSEAAGDAADDMAEVSGDAITGEGAAASRPTGSGAVQSREDVRRALDRVCEYLERQEPSNPAALFARRAQRMLNMPFLDIMQELSPDAVQNLEKLTGAKAKQQDN